MPSVVNRRAAFNFCNPFDDLLPTPNSDIDVNDRAQLWGAYSLGENLIDVKDETVNINRYNFLIDHENNDLSEYSFITGTPTVVTPGLNSTSYALRLDPGSDKAVALLAHAGTRIELEYYIDITGIFTLSAGNQFVALAEADETLVAYLRSSAGANVFFRIIDDGAGENNSGSETLPTNYNGPIKYIIQKSTTVSSNDGWAELWINGVLEQTISNIDLYNNFDAIATLVVHHTSGTDAYNVDEINFTSKEDGFNILGLIHLLAETLNISEVIVRLTGLIRNIGEILNISETIIRIAAFVRILAETANIVEIILNVKGLFKILVETVSIPEAITRITGLFKIIVDTVNVSKAILSILGRLKIIADTINVSETSVKVYEYIKILVETISVQDTRLRFISLVRVIVDGIAISVQDTRLRFISLVRIDNDVVNISELIHQPIKGFTRILNEILNISETIFNFLGIVEIINEILNISENIIKLRGLVKDIPEIVSITEAKQRIFTFVRLISETLYIVEAILVVKSLVRIISSSLNISEAIAKVFSRVRLITETVNINETNFLIHGFNKIVNEVLNISETILQRIDIIKFVSEILNISEGVLRFRSLIRRLNENLLVSETIRKVSGFTRVIATDSLNIVETTLKPKVSVKIEDETINVAETKLSFLILYLISKAVKKTGVAIGDTLRRTNIYQLGRYGVQIVLNRRGVKID